jgi:putative transposase
MSGHVYHELFVHLVWRTKDSAPILTGDFERHVHDYLLWRARVSKGLYLHIVGGMDDHVHLAIGYEPSWSVSDIVKDLKGSCSHEMNERAGRKVLEWQRGFGAVSFGRRNLPTVIEYIRSQRLRHAAGNTHERLERSASDEEAKTGEPEGSGSSD